MKPISRQLRWKRKQRAAGLCVQCGKAATGAYCGRCQKKRRLLLGQKPWKLGHRGRPPKHAEAALARETIRRALKTIVDELGVLGLQDAAFVEASETLMQRVGSHDPKKS